MYSSATAREKKKKSEFVLLDGKGDNSIRRGGLSIQKPSTLLPLPRLAAQTAALVSSLGRGVKRRYGLTIFNLGQISLACSVFTLGWTMTSSPVAPGGQSQGFFFFHFAAFLGLSLTGYPVDWRGDLVLVPGLQAIHRAQDLGGVAACAGGI
jgi:hypothetical protein